MAVDLHLLAFVLANLFVLALGVALVAVSYAAYRRRNRPELRLAAVGFALITLGATLEAIYQLGIRGTYYITGVELLGLQMTESLLITGGLLALVYSLLRY